MTDKLLRLRDVIDRTGLSRSTIYRRLDDGIFPAPVRIGDFAVRWRESALQQWMASLPRAGGTIAETGSKP